MSVRVLDMWSGGLGVPCENRVRQKQGTEVRSV